MSSDEFYREGALAVADGFLFKMDWDFIEHVNLVAQKEKWESVMVVDDDTSLRDIVVNCFTKNGFKNVNCYGNVSDATTAYKSLKPDLILSDIEMTDGSGFELAHIVTQYKQP